MDSVQLPQERRPVDVALDVDIGSPHKPGVRAPRVRSGSRPDDAIYHGVSLAVSLTAVAILVLMVVVLAVAAWPAITGLGFGFLVQTVWNTSTNVYGAVPFVVGTLITTMLALLLAVPISLAIALLLTEYVPSRVAVVLEIVIDVAAGIPSIVFGAWSLLVLIPWLSNTVEPAVASVFGWFPPLDPNNSPAGITGEGMIPASLVLATMIFPTIVAVTRNSLRSTPNEMREASLGLGATQWETATRVVLRQARSGALGAIILAVGRALGESIAVVYIIGTSPRLPQSLWDLGSTLASQLFTQLYGGGFLPGTLTEPALYELGLLLLVLSLFTSLAGRLLTQRFAGATLIGGGR